MTFKKHPKNWFRATATVAALVFITACGSAKKVDEETDTQVETQTDSQIKNLVERSYQYVAMFNVIQKFTFDESSGAMFAGGFNKSIAATALADHHMTSIARPNNDTLYQLNTLDLRDDAMIIEFPAIDSKFAALQISGYSHYTGVPLTTTEGDFSKPTKVLFYTERTKGYAGEAVEGVDKIVEADGDFFIAVLRAMPHQIDATRMAGIVKSLQDTKIISLAEFQGKSAKATSPVVFPQYKATDVNIFEENLAEVIQFVMNHTTFDENDEMDQAFLAAFKPFGIAPGNTFDAEKAQVLSNKRISEIASEVQQETLASFMNPEVTARVLPQLFMPKGQVDLEAQVFQSVIGPIGLPAHQAMYFPLGSVMNSENDYVIKMTADQLPPAQAFWSITLYDFENGFFIPNDQMKYSVGENAGFKLDSEGGLEIHISAEQPIGVPAENWLPISRDNIGLALQIRVYHPRLAEMPAWIENMPAAEVVEK